MTRYPPIQIVDQADQPVGRASLTEAYEQGLPHRVIYVIVEDTDDKVLLQKRGPNVATYPGCWDISTAGHVDEGETYELAARRELAEELGMNDEGFELEELGKYYDENVINGFRLNRFRKTYKVVIQAGTTLRPHLTELSGIRWLSIAEVKKLAADHPDKIAIGLRQCLEEHYSKT
ncbi:MAG TPA: NUDIX domain-containing protein [Candidatus Dormibacteraeota bacterium]|nr:NUDIX domain-containing protein [Candidatus Dormibacteraeota bacterium]